MYAERKVSEFVHIVLNHFLGACGEQVSSGFDVGVNLGIRVGLGLLLQLSYSRLLSKVMRLVIISILNFLLLRLIKLNSLHITFIIFLANLGPPVLEEFSLGLEKWSLLVV